MTEPESLPTPSSQPPDSPGETHVSLRVKLAPGTRLRVRLETESLDGSPHPAQELVFEPPSGASQDASAARNPAEAAPSPREVVLRPAALPWRPRRIFSWLSAVDLPALRRVETATWLFGAALLVYLFTRLYALGSYPIYFFTDEAVQTVLASDFIRDGFQNYAKDFLPTYFQNVYQYNLSVSVYLQVLPTLLLGKSVEVTRGVAALMTLLAPVSLGLAFQKAFGSARPWLAALVLSIMPAWFLHSRTAFETSLAVSFYAATLYCYLRYRLAGEASSQGNAAAIPYGDAGATPQGGAGAIAGGADQKGLPPLHGSAAQPPDPRPWGRGRDISAVFLPAWAKKPLKNNSPRPAGGGLGGVGRTFQAAHTDPPQGGAGAIPDGGVRRLWRRLAGPANGPDARWLYASIALAALCFYTYSPAQMVIAVTAVLLFFSDLRYHLRQPRRVALTTLGLAVLVGLPYLRFQLAHPDETLRHLTQIGSYWIAPISLGEKLGDYFTEYLSGLNPLYWFLANNADLARHTMDSYGHLLIINLPFVAIGLGRAIKNVRRPEQRVLLAALLAAPSGAALVGMGITRALFIVVPAALLAALGMEACIAWLARLRRASTSQLAGGLFVVLAGFNLILLGDALRRGPTWSTNYGLAGMQYGASQVFGEIIAYHTAHPDTPILLSPTWANGTDIVARFFLPDSVPVSLASINTFLDQKHDFPADTLFILPPEEYSRARDSGKFTGMVVEKTLPWPDGQPGFYLLHMRYVDDIDAVFARQLEERKAVLPGEVQAGGETLQVHYSALDMGKIGNLFDGDLNTLTRTQAANPFKLQIDFPTPHTLKGLGLRIGGTATTLDISVQVEGESQARTFHLEQPESPLMRTLEVDFGGPLAVQSLFILMKNTNDPEPGHVHLWEVMWR